REIVALGERIFSKLLKRSEAQPYIYPKGKSMVGSTRRDRSNWVNNGVMPQYSIKRTKVKLNMSFAFDHAAACNACEVAACISLLHPKKLHRLQPKPHNYMLYCWQDHALSVLPSEICLKDYINPNNFCWLWSIHNCKRDWKHLFLHGSCMERNLKILCELGSRSWFGVLNMEMVNRAIKMEYCICLSAYDDGAELHEISCGQHFHCTCIDKYLYIIATWPVQIQQSEKQLYQPIVGIMQSAKKGWVKVPDYKSFQTVKGSLKFKRKGQDLFYEHTLSLTEALCRFQF
ncbi:hypothetical protein ACJX0J_016583, partial [Zea mays]